MVKSGIRPQFYGGPDPITIRKMESILRNAAQLRTNASWPISGLPTSMQKGYYETAELDPRRNYAHDCGWPIAVSPQDYKELIDREPIAGFVNNIYPIESWQVEPIVSEDSTITKTDFEESYKALHDGLNREPSYYSGESGSVVMQHLITLDLLSGVGRYGVLLFGLNDGKDLEEPVDILNPPPGGMKCLFLRSFPEHMAKVVMFDMDWNSPRYGLPIRYLITFADPQDMSTTGVNENFMARQVHWSRVLHVPDLWHHQSASPIFAIERCKPLLNAILDARKIRGSSAEGYYQACMNALHFGTHPQLGPDAEMDRESILDMYEQFANGLQRILITSGAEVKSIAPTLPDPSPSMLIQMQAICLKMRVPLRVALGNEIGQLASQDDRIRWVKRLFARQQEHNTPRILIPFLDRLINYGILAKPKTGYKIKWPKIDIQTIDERMQAFYNRTQAYGLYTTQNIEAIVPPFEYMTKFDDFTPEEATVMCAASEAHMDDLMSGERNLMDAIPGSADLANPAAGPIGSTPGQYERPEQFDDGNTPRVAAVPEQK